LVIEILFNVVQPVKKIIRTALIRPYPESLLTNNYRGDLRTIKLLFVLPVVYYKLIKKQNQFVILLAKENAVIILYSQYFA